MHTPTLLLVSTIVLAAPASARPAADAHIVRPYRGDVLTVDGRIDASGQRPASVRVGQRIEAPLYAARHAVTAPPGHKPAKRGQRWVRYGADRILVNTRTGRVLRVAADRG